MDIEYYLDSASPMEGITSTCSPSDLASSHVMVCPGEGYFGFLTCDLLREVLKFIHDDVTYGRVAQVNKRWHRETQIAWKYSAEYRGLLVDANFWLERNRDWKWICHCNLRVYKPEDFKHGPGTLVVCTELGVETYKGDFVNNKKEGYGELVVADTVYKGAFSDDMKNGWGILKSNNGSYEGYWKDDKKDGFGVYTYANQDTYRGEWKNGMKEGRGVYTFGKGLWEGDVYEGEWKADKKCGYGKYTWKDGDMYEGQFKNDNFNGSGTYHYYSCGDKYTGDWEDDSKHGIGTYTYAHGGQYTGEFKNNKRHGSGVFKWSDGDEFSGRWVKGSRRGRGWFTTKDGIKELQIWDHYSEANDANYSKLEPAKFPRFHFL